MSYPEHITERRTTSGLAVASLILGILWLVWLGSILAVIFGHIARRQTHHPYVDGGGLAIAGLILGYIGIGTLALWIAMFWGAVVGA